MDLQRPCRYFERAVPGPPDHPDGTPGYDWQKLFNTCGGINLAFAGRGVAVRRCECRTVLGVRERVCAKCRTRHRQATYRPYRGRRHRRAAVNENKPQIPPRRAGFVAVYKGQTHRKADRPTRAVLAS